MKLERHTPGRVSLGIKLKRVVWNVMRRWPWGGMGVEIDENAVYKNVESWIVVNENPCKIIKMRKIEKIKFGGIILSVLSSESCAPKAVLHKEWRTVG